jgi:prepilin-type N-terminal cleavage/methylation domain-containing protein
MEKLVCSSINCPLAGKPKAFDMKKNETGKVVGRREIKARGFTLVEVMITLAIFGTALVVLLYYQQRNSVITKANDTSKGVMSLVSSIRGHFMPMNSYAGLYSNWLYDMKITPPPLARNDSALELVDPWKNRIMINGGDNFFLIEMRMPGNNEKEACIAMTTTLAAGAREVWVGDPQGYNIFPNVEIVGIEGPTAVRYKGPGLTPDRSKLAAACGISNPFLYMIFD